MRALAEPLRAACRRIRCRCRSILSGHRPIVACREAPRADCGIRRAVAAPKPRVPDAPFRAHAGRQAAPFDAAFWLAFFLASWAISLSPGPGAIAVMSSRRSTMGFARGCFATFGLVLGFWTQLVVRRRRARRADRDVGARRSPSSSGSAWPTSSGSASRSGARARRRSSRPATPRAHAAPNRRSRLGHQRRQSQGNGLHAGRRAAVPRSRASRSCRSTP